jgi:WhiB family redox-sensing transcriptional regulator
LVDLLDIAGEVWQDRAVCAQVGFDMFFPEKGGSTQEAKQVCEGCPVRAECLEYALTENIGHGIWGGLSVPEREKLRRQRIEGDPRRQRKQYAVKRDAQIAKLCTLGVASRVIADQVGVSPRTVFRARNRLDQAA